MRETIEFRIPEEHASQYLAAGEGVNLGGSVRKIEMAINDSRLIDVGRINKELKRDGRAFFTAWIPHRQYSSSELERAELFQVIVRSTFEPPGEECGTEYDDSKACPLCSAGRRQVSQLKLDVTRIPRSKDIAQTISNEIVVSERLADLIRESNLSGLELAPVGHVGKSSRGMQNWHQLKVISRYVSIAPQTRIGIDPFDDDEKGRYRCPWGTGHAKGLALLSELWVSRSEWDGSDFACTRDLIGVRRGLLTPTRPIVISSRTWRLFSEHKIKGCLFEVARFD